MTPLESALKRLRSAYHAYNSDHRDTQLPVDFFLNLLLESVRHVVRQTLAENQDLLFEQLVQTEAVTILWLEQITAQKED